MWNGKPRLLLESLVAKLSLRDCWKFWVALLGERGVCGVNTKLQLSMTTGNCVLWNWTERMWLTCLFVEQIPHNVLYAFSAFFTVFFFSVSVKDKLQFKNKFHRRRAISLVRETRRTAGDKCVCVWAHWATKTREEQIELWQESECLCRMKIKPTTVLFWPFQCKFHSI